MSLVALSELLGAAVYDPSGRTRARVSDVAIAPQEHPTRVAFRIVRSPEGDRLVPAGDLAAVGEIVRTLSAAGDWQPAGPPDGVLFLGRDLLDRQIIDVHGRKVVRVNDVELEQAPVAGRALLTVVSVNVGARGAVRRLCRGLVPPRALRALIERIPPHVIPWPFVDLLETDPARRVKLKIAYERLSRLHPADIADIVEDLPQADREAVFETIDEEVAAEALEEVEPDIQKAIVESLDSDRAADIVGEMDPDAAADLLADLSEDRTGAILREMEAEERREVSELLAFGGRTAAGRMTTDVVAVPATGSVAEAIESLRSFEGGPEALATVYLLGPAGELRGAVPIVRLVTNPPAAPLATLAIEPIHCALDTPDDEVAELFDKYNLMTLAVADGAGRLAGIITADDVIAMLRQRS
jgi:magnesium transporter